MAHVVRASHLDQYDVFDLLMEFKAKYFNYPVDYDNAMRSLEHVMDNGICLIAVEDGETIGVILGSIVAHPMMEGLVLQELAWYCRKPGAGLKLLKEFERVGKERGADRIAASTLRSNPEIEKLMLKLGYEPVEIGWQKPLGE